MQFVPSETVNTATAESSLGRGSHRTRKRIVFGKPRNRRLERIGSDHIEESRGESIQRERQKPVFSNSEVILKTCVNDPVNLVDRT